jgi:predicted enzyme involved in methoxymalonyl-ACP biosynthesis
MSIIQIENSTAIIDSLLMSCRVIGRNLEFAFFDEIVKFLLDKKIKKLFGSFIITPKNKQVESFYEKLGFKSINKNELQNDFIIHLEDYKFKNIPYIKIK